MEILSYIKGNLVLQTVLICAGIYILFMIQKNRETLDNVASDPVASAGTSAQPLMDAAPVVAAAEPEAPKAPDAPEAPQAPAVQEIVAQPLISGSTAIPSQEGANEAEFKISSGDLTTLDLLPKYDQESNFADQNAVSKLLQEQNFVQAGYHFGINTVVQSNKIPYHDLRSVPPVPKEEIGPWSQSSYEQPMGSGRVKFELGSA